MHHGKTLDWEITNVEHQFDRTYTGKTIPSQTLDLKHVEFLKVSEKPSHATSFGRS